MALIGEHMATQMPVGRIDGQILDGRDPEQYRMCLNWRVKRWAWEFLRRNVEFIFYCEMLREAPSQDQRQAARKFGLTQFKSFDAPSPTASDQPKFDVRRVTKWARVSERPKLVPARDLKPGEIMILTELTYVAGWDLILKSKLRAIEAALRKHVKAQQQVMPVDERKPPPRQTRVKGGVLRLIELLRILDCLAAGMQPIDIARAVYPREYRGVADEDVAIRFRERIEDAEANAKAGYHSLAVWERKAFYKSREEARAGFENWALSHCA